MSIESDVGSDSKATTAIFKIAILSIFLLRLSRVNIAEICSISPTARAVKRSVLTAAVGRLRADECLIVRTPYLHLLISISYIQFY